jgi:hypothetical protein
MSLTIVVPARADPGGMTAPCLRAAAGSARALRLAIDFVLVADHSDNQAAIVDVFQRFRREEPALRVRIARARRWLHYTGAMSTGLHVADSGDVFLLSNDMLITPHFLLAVLGVAGACPAAGIVRGTSDYVDTHPEHEVAPQPRLTTYEAMLGFAAQQFEANGLSYTIDGLLSGDAVLVKRALIDAIGVMDTRFFGYFGDVDYGMRARRAGFDLACAKGAWLHHVGGGQLIADAQQPGRDMQQVNAARLALLRDAYAAFRAKWGVAEPADYTPHSDLRAIVAQAESSAAPQPDVRLPQAFLDDIELV